VKPRNPRPITPAIVVFTLCLVLLSTGMSCAKPTHSVMVPMRDGTKLATDIFLPDGKGPWPAVLFRTRRAWRSSALTPFTTISGRASTPSSWPTASTSP